MEEVAENLNTTKGTIQVWLPKIKYFLLLILPTVEKIIGTIIYYTVKISKSIMRTIIEQLKD